MSAESPVKTEQFRSLDQISQESIDWTWSTTLDSIENIMRSKNPSLRAYMAGRYFVTDKKKFDFEHYLKGFHFVYGVFSHEIKRLKREESEFEPKSVQEMIERVHDRRIKGRKVSRKEVLITRRFVKRKFLKLLRMEDPVLYEAIKNEISSHGGIPTDYLYGAAEIYFQFRPELRADLLERKRHGEVSLLNSDSFSIESY